MPYSFNIRIELFKEENIPKYHFITVEKILYRNGKNSGTNEFFGIVIDNWTFQPRSGKNSVYSQKSWGQDEINKRSFPDPTGF